MSREAAIEYAKIKLEIKHLEQKMKTLQPEVVAFITTAVIENTPAKLQEIEDLGSFSWYPKRTYKFTPEYDRLIQAAEARKAEELAHGTYLSVTEIPIVVFKEATKK